MKYIEGNIIDVVGRRIIKGRLFYNKKIDRIEADDKVLSEKFILPGFIDAHVHIESSMLTPLEYSKVAVRHGVIAAVTDPHEIANVCGMEGVNFMVENAKKTPMKIYSGAPSCVPATNFETSGATIGPEHIEELFAKGTCSHLSEMMNFPGVIFNNPDVQAKLQITKKHNKKIDGHAPLLSGADLIKYVNSGISTDHECTNLNEAYEKIELGMKIMLRNSSASKDFDQLISLISSHPNEVMLCTDDCHPDNLEQTYINGMVKKAIDQQYDLFNVLQAANKNAIQHYNLSVGMLQISDPSDFIVVDNFQKFNILSTVVDGVEVYDGTDVLIDGRNDLLINNFFANDIELEDLKVEKRSNLINVIQIIPDSLLTGKCEYHTNNITPFHEINVEDDVLKIVVLNRYHKAKPAVAFIKGMGIKHGAIAQTIAHDSHNIVAVGTDDRLLLKAIQLINNNKGGMVVCDQYMSKTLPLPIAGLMSELDCSTVAMQYKEMTELVHNMGSQLKSPFMTLAFMSLLVIPEIKLSDKGLFDVGIFAFIDLEN